jgi:hypothetical protein
VRNEEISADFVRIVLENVIEADVLGNLSVDRSTA